MTTEDIPAPGPRTLSMTTLMTPSMVNFSGKIHGGALLKLLDEVAFSCAAQFSGRYVVTLLVDEVRFRAPVQVGDLVTFHASVNRVGRTSMEVGIRVMAASPIERSSRHVISCFFLMVAMGDDGRAVAVPRFTPQDDTARRRWQQAEARDALRRARPSSN